MRACSLALLLALPLASAHGNHGHEDAICGAKGYDKGTPKAYLVSKKKDQGTNSGCTMLCAADAKCQSYSFGSGICKLYTSDLKHNLVRNANSPYTFSEKDCIDHFATHSASIASRISVDYASASARAAAMARSAAAAANAQTTIASPDAQKNTESRPSTRTISTTSKVSKTVSEVVSTTITLASPSGSDSASIADRGDDEESSIVCGRRGYHEGVMRLFQYDWKSQESNVAACKELCMVKNGCGCFTYRAGACMLFEGAVQDGVLSSDESDYFFYDVDCPRGELCLGPLR